MTRTRVALLGPPGAGKGTQAKRMVERLRLVHLSTGDILRSEVAGDTALGRKAKSYMDRGELVPDDLIIDMIRGRIERADGRFLLDGFPRTVAQAAALDGITPLDVAIDIELAREEVIRRLTSRRVCRRCGKIHNLAYDPPPDPTQCAACGGKLHQRDDDRQEVIENRFDVYQRQTEPLIEFYDRRGLLERVDGDRTSDEVFDEILRILGG